MELQACTCGPQEGCTKPCDRNAKDAWTRKAPPEALHDAHSVLDEARRCYHEAFRAAFPVGSVVTSIKRGRVQCEILRHGGRDDALVRSETGKEYWLDAYWIVEAGIGNDS